MQLATPQKRLGPRAFLAAVAAVCMLAQLPIDLYVPALPAMREELCVTAPVLNLTMSVFFAGSAAAIILAGPLQDRFGRRPVFVAACFLLFLGALGCALSPNIAALIGFRIVQAAGFGFETTVATALVQDSYEGRDLQFGMTFLQSMMIVGPALAPFAGSYLLLCFGWRGIFWTLAALGLVQTMLALLTSETLGQDLRIQGSALEAAGISASKALALVRDKGFICLALMVGAAAVPYFAWIATVSYTILDRFGAGLAAYSLCYAGTVAVSIAAPYVFMAAGRRLGPNQIFVLCCALMGASAVLLGLFGALSPAAFTLAFLPVTLGEGILRPMGFILLLDRPQEEVGAASTAANFLYSMMMAGGTAAGTLAVWPDYIVGVAVLAALASAAMVLLFAGGVRGRGYELPEDAGS